MMNLYPWNFNFVWCFWGLGGCLDSECSWFVFGVFLCFLGVMFWLASCFSFGCGSRVAYAGVLSL